MSEPSREEIAKELNLIKMYLVKHDRPGYAEVLEKAISFLESSAQEPSDEIYEYALGILNKLDFEGLSLQEKVNLLVKSLLPGQEPSEAEVAILVQKWATELAICDDYMMTMKLARQMLKEYRELLRRG